MAIQNKNKAKQTKSSPHSKEKDSPMLAGSPLSAQKAYQEAVPAAANRAAEKPISKAYKGLDTDLARDNLENDIPDADMHDI